MTPKKKHIAIIIPYYGPWPEWLPFFLKSCSVHKEWDWFLFHDQQVPSWVPENVHFVSLPLEKLGRLIREKAGVEVPLHDPYKLCDLKPAFGLIFQEFLKPYPYWGYGDLDLIYGNLSEYFRPEILSGYDLFSTHPDFVPAPLVVLKNEKQMRVLFKKVESFREHFSRPYYCGFDERLFRFCPPGPEWVQRFIRRVRVEGSVPLYRTIQGMKKIGFSNIFQGKKKKENPQIEKAPKDFSSVVHRAAERGTLRLLSRHEDLSDLALKKRGIKKWRMKWHQGTLIEELSGRELLHFHFQLLKGRRSFRIPPFQPDKDTFFITPQGFSYE